MDEQGHEMPPRPTAPPMPGRAPGAEQVPLAEWLRMPRPADAPLGVWRAGYEPRPEEEPERTPTRQLAFGAGLSAIAAWFLASLLWNGYLGSYWLWPLFVLTPDAWRSSWAIVVASYLYYAIFLAVLLLVFGRLGNWGECLRRARRWVQRQRTSADPGMVPRPRTPAPPLEDDPASWAELRRDGALAEADYLTGELQAGRVQDADVARILHAWRQAGADPERRAAVLGDVRRRGGGACPHGSGARDLPQRAAQHDLTERQVRVGFAVDEVRNPYPYRTAGVALSPGLLSTGLLVVGPTGAGKTRRIVRPVVESGCLQAVVGQTAVVVVSDRGDDCAPRGWFDAVLDCTAHAGAGAEGRRPALDLFGGVEDPDEAGAIAAEALVGDVTASLPGEELRPAVSAVAQVIGPYRAVHGRFPGVGELRELVDGGTALEELQRAVATKELRVEQRELDAFRRQSSSVVALLADRLGLLDRPAVAGVVAADVGVTPLDRLDRPVRVRIDLPEGVHAQAGRIMARLVCAHFASVAPRRPAGAAWPLLVLDDATATITSQSLEAMQRLRAAGCGVVLALRALADVPEALRQQVVSVCGCRAVCAGISPWDARYFADAWGSEIVEELTVTDRQIHADEPLQKMMYGLKRLATGKHVTVQAVSKSRSRRQRWPAEDLATELPGGHVVISVAAPDGHRSSPVLVHLDG